jgi:hypothetical protein
LSGGNDCQLKHVYSLAACLVVNNILPIPTTASDDFNALIDAASCLKIGTYIPKTKRKMDYLLVEMFSCFIADACALVTTTCALSTRAAARMQLLMTTPSATKLSILDG